MDKKVERIINLYNRLAEGEVLNKAAEVRKEKSSEQDILIVGDYKIVDETIVEYSGEEETITILEGVKRIASDAFHNNKLIRRVVIHDGIKDIERK